MHFMLRNGPTSKLLGSCYVLDSSTGYEGQPPTQSTTLLGKVRSSYEIFPFSLYFFYCTKTEELLGWAARGDCAFLQHGMSQGSCCSTSMGTTVPALLQESTQTCHRFLTSVGEMHWGKGLFGREHH